jgi:hypothetical protein
VIRAGPTGFFQTDRHFRREAGAAVENSGESVAGDAEHLRGFDYAEVQRVEAGVLEGVSGVGWGGFFITGISL